MESLGLQTTALIALCVMTSNPLPAAARVDEAAVRDWIAARQLESKSLLPIQGVELTWVVEDHTYPVGEEWDKLQSEVPGKPDHPERWYFEAYKRRRAGQPDVRTLTIYALDDASYRLNRSVDFLNQAELPEGLRNSYSDQVITPKLAWTLSPRQLTVVDPRAGFPENQDWASASASLTIELRLITSGLMSSVKTFDKIENIVTNAENVEARLVRTKPESQQATAYLKGVWRRQWSWLCLSEVRLEVQGPVASFRAPRSWTADDWKYEAAAGRPLPGKIEVHATDNRLLYRALLKQVSALERDRFNSLAQLPETGGSDPIRGPATFLSISDFRAGIRTLLPTTDGISKTEGEAVTTQLPQSQSDRRAPTLRVLGWVLLSGLVAIVVLLRVRAIRS